MPVELVWDGKYTDDEKKIRKSPLKIALPFQTVETVNESVQERQRNMFAAASQAEWRNRLIKHRRQPCSIPTTIYIFTIFRAARQSV